jgi:large subunit ribosomal protein L7A
VLDSLKNSKKAIGLKQSLRALENDTVKMLFIARDADERVVRPLIEQSKKKNVEVQFVDTMKQLGKVCGIEIGAAAASLLK